MEPIDKIDKKIFFFGVIHFFWLFSLWSRVEKAQTEQKYVIWCTADIYIFKN